MLKYVLILILSISNLLASCRTMEQQTIEKYTWDASPTAPKGYPVQVYKGRFTDASGHATIVPNGHYLQDGWGASLITWIAGDDSKPLPQQLELTWFSFAENKFYTGTFTLPAAELNTLFEEGYYNKRKKETYDRFVVGMAPGGMVVVWLRGQNQVELARFQATETEVDWDDFYYRSVGGNSYGKADRVSDVKEEQAKLQPEVQQQLKKGPLSASRWDNYRKKYHWSVVLAADEKLEDYAIKYWNGEQERLPGNKQLLQDSKTPKPLPQAISLFTEGEKKRRLDITFEEQPLMDALKGLKATDLLEFVVERKEGDHTAVLSARLRGQAVPLPGVRIAVYED